MDFTNMGNLRERGVIKSVVSWLRLFRSELWTSEYVSLDPRDQEGEEDLRGIGKRSPHAIVGRGNHAHRTGASTSLLGLIAVTARL